MNVLYLSYDGMTDPLGQSQVLPYLFGIARAGHNITLISFEKQHRYKLFRDEIELICKANNIDWQPLLYTKRPPVLSTIWDVMKMRRRAFSLHGKKKFTIVHCRSYISSLVGLDLKRTLGLKFLFDMRGFWADERVEGRLWNLENPLYNIVHKYFKRKETQFLNGADYVISLTQNASNEIHTWDSINHQPVPIEVIPCCADMKLFDPLTIKANDQSDLRSKLGIGDDDFVLSYIGSLGTWYMLDEMLDFFSALLKEKPLSKFLVITNDLETDLQSKAAKRQIPQEQIIVTQAERNAMPLYISLSSATLFFIKPSFSKKASSPVKQGEAMGMGILIICNANVGDTDAIVGERGIVINSFAEEAYQTAIRQLQQSVFAAGEIRRYALINLSLESGIEKYLGVYNQLAS